MDRTRLIAGAVMLSAALVALLATSWYIFFYQPGRTSHEDFLRPDTALRLEVQPAEIQWYITKLAPGFTKYINKIPKLSPGQAFAGRIDWVHAMPYEISLLYHHDTAETMDVTLFINLHPNDPHFGETLTDAGFFREVGWMDWGPGGLSREGESALSAEAQVHISQETQRMLAQTWASSGLMDAPPLDGTHMIELSADNTGGVLMILHRALVQGDGRVGGREVNGFLMERWPDIAQVHFWADLVDDDLVQIRVEAECLDSTGAERAVESIEALAAEIAYEFGRMEFAFEGSARSEGAKAIGEYEFYGFEEKLQRALGS